MKTKHSPKGKKDELDPKEWDFDPIPKHEIGACWLYEYTREAEKLKSASKGSRKQGSARFPELINVSVGADVPWRELDQKVRSELVEGLNKGDDLCWNRVSFGMLHIETLRQSEAANVKSIEAFRDVHKISYKMLPEGADGIEYGFFAINWNFSDADIKCVFDKWLSEQRKDRRKRGLTKIKYRERGRGGLRDKLNWLGALRVVNHYRTNELVEYQLQDSKLKVAAPYRYSSDLYENAKKARKLLKGMSAD